MSKVIHNKAMAGAEVKIGYETVLGDPDGNFVVADDTAAEFLAQTPGWGPGKNPDPQSAKKVKGSPLLGDPQTVIARLSEEASQREVQISNLTARNATLTSEVNKLRTALLQDTEEEEAAETLEKATRTPVTPSEVQQAAEEEAASGEPGPRPSTVPEGDPQMTWTAPQLRAYGEWMGFEPPKTATKSDMYQMYMEDED